MLRKLIGADVLNSQPEKTRTFSLSGQPETEFEAGILPLHEEISKAKNTYRQSYYSDSSAPLSMHCGWSSDKAQILAYEAFSSLFDRGGDVLDLGCGNGALLRFLLSRLSVKIYPYGVDFLEESIQEAKTVVLSDFSDNFFASSIDDFNPGVQKFSYIITSPDYTFDPDVRKHVKKCFSWLEPCGKLMLYDYKGSEYFKDFVKSWCDLDIGSVEVIETNLTAIVCYVKD